MNETKELSRLNILEILASQQASSLGELHRLIPCNPLDLDAVCHNMHADGLIVFNDGIHLTITREGREYALCERARVDQEAAQTAKQEKQQSFQNKVSVASVLVPLVSFVLGIVAEHYVGIIGFLSRALS